MNQGCQPVYVDPPPLGRMAAAHSDNSSLAIPDNLDLPDVSAATIGEFLDEYCSGKTRQVCEEHEFHANESPALEPMNTTFLNSGGSPCKSFVCDTSQHENPISNVDQRCSNPKDLQVTSMHSGMTRQSFASDLPGGEPPTGKVNGGGESFASHTLQHENPNSNIDQRCSNPEDPQVTHMNSGKTRQPSLPAAGLLCSSGAGLVSKADLTQGEKHEFQANESHMLQPQNKTFLNSGGSPCKSFESHTSQPEDPVSNVDQRCSKPADLQSANVHSREGVNVIGQSSRFLKGRAHEGAWSRNSRAQTVQPRKRISHVLPVTSAHQEYTSARCEKHEFHANESHALQPMKPAFLKSCRSSNISQRCKSTTSKITKSRQTIGLSKVSVLRGPMAKDDSTQASGGLMRNLRMEAASLFERQFVGFVKQHQKAQGWSPASRVSPARISKQVSQHWLTNHGQCPLSQQAMSSIAGLPHTNLPPGTLGNGTTGLHGLPCTSHFNNHRTDNLMAEVMDITSDMIESFLEEQCEQKNMEDVGTLPSKREVTCDVGPTKGIPKTCEDPGNHVHHPRVASCFGSLNRPLEAFLRALNTSSHCGWEPSDYGSCAAQNPSMIIAGPANVERGLLQPTARSPGAPFNNVTGHAGNVHFPQSDMTPSVASCSGSPNRPLERSHRAINTISLVGLELSDHVVCTGQSPTTLITRPANIEQELLQPPSRCPGAPFNNVTGHAGDVHFPQSDVTPSVASCSGSPNRLLERSHRAPNTISLVGLELSDHVVCTAQIPSSVNTGSENVKRVPPQLASRSPGAHFNNGTGHASNVQYPHFDASPQALHTVSPSSQSSLSPSSSSSPVDKGCSICGENIRKGCGHYGGLCCQSCRSFFRRCVAMLKRKGGTHIAGMMRCRRSAGKGRDRPCTISPETRRICVKCRYEKCLSVGLRPHLVNCAETGVTSRTASVAKAQTVSKNGGNKYRNGCHDDLQLDFHLSSGFQTNDAEMKLDGTLVRSPETGGTFRTASLVRANANTYVENGDSAEGGSAGLSIGFFTTDSDQELDKHLVQLAKTSSTLQTALVEKVETTLKNGRNKDRNGHREDLQFDIHAPNRFPMQNGNATGSASEHLSSQRQGHATSGHCLGVERCSSNDCMSPIKMERISSVKQSPEVGVFSSIHCGVKHDCQSFSGQCRQISGDLSHPIYFGNYSGSRSAATESNSLHTDIQSEGETLKSEVDSATSDKVLLDANKIALNGESKTDVKSLERDNLTEWRAIEHLWDDELPKLTEEAVIKLAGEMEENLLSESSTTLDHGDIDSLVNPLETNRTAKVASMTKAMTHLQKTTTVERNICPPFRFQDNVDIECLNNPLETNRTTRVASATQAMTPLRKTTMLERNIYPTDKSFRFQEIESDTELEHNGEEMKVENNESGLGSMNSAENNLKLCRLDDTLLKDLEEISRSSLDEPFYHSRSTLAPLTLLQHTYNSNSAFLVGATKGHMETTRLIDFHKGFGNCDCGIKHLNLRQYAKLHFSIYESFARVVDAFMELREGDRRKLLERSAKLHLAYLLARYFTADSGWDQVNWLVGESDLVCTMTPRQAQTLSHVPLDSLANACPCSLEQAKRLISDCLLLKQFFVKGEDQDSAKFVTAWLLLFHGANLGLDCEERLASKMASNVAYIARAYNVPVENFRATLHILEAIVEPFDKVLGLVNADTFDSSLELWSSWIQRL